MKIRFGIITISDRSARGERADLSGPALIEMIIQQGWKVISTTIIPDDYEEIKKQLLDWSSSGDLDVILTSGGTGFTAHDITPEATQAVIERNAPGLAEAMRAANLQITPHAMLSRAIVGIRMSTLIINLPGSPRAAVENLQVLLPVLAHAVELLQGKPTAEKNHTYSIKN